MRLLRALALYRTLPRYYKLRQIWQIAGDANRYYGHMMKWSNINSFWRATI